MLDGLSAILYSRFPGERSGIIQNKVAVPVRPLLASSLVFEHVFGVPARNETEAVPTFKLNIINALIEQIVKLGKKHTPLPPDVLQTNDKTNDVIENLHARFMQAETAFGRYGSGLAPEPGVAFNLLA